MFIRDIDAFFACVGHEFFDKDGRAPGVCSWDETMCSIGRIVRCGALRTLKHVGGLVDHFIVAAEQTQLAHRVISDT